jgi:hypothetical protein
VPIEEDNRGYNIISSPMPKPERPVNRIIADEFPEKTYSKSVYDMPLDRDVFRVNPPPSKTTTVNYGYDPRFPPKLPVNSFVGRVNYNTANTNAEINTPGVNFLEKSRKRIDNRPNKTPHSLRDEGLIHAINARASGDRIMSRLAHSDGEDRMILNTVTTNRRDNSFNAYTNHINHRINSRRESYAGVRSAHTYNRLG